MMKKLFSSVLFGAIALVGAMGLAACSDKDSVETADPNANTEAGEVPVQFVFNVETNSQSSNTRMSDKNVQANGSNSFRGITNTRILAYKQDGSSHLTAPAKATRLFDLGTVAGNGSLTSENSTRVLEISLPNGTNAMMFYGKAIKDKSDREQGRVRGYVFENNSNDTTVNQEGLHTQFILDPRVSQYEYDAQGNKGQETTEYKVWVQTRDLLERILNRITENGLHKEQGEGGRDLRARIWWPASHVEDYSLRGPLVDLTKLPNPGKDTVAIDTLNSNIGTAIYKLESPVAATVTLNYKGTDGADHTYTVTFDGARLTTNMTTYEYHVGEVDWKDYGTLASGGTISHSGFGSGYVMTPLEEILGNLYNNFTKIKDGEIRAGSASAINRMVQDMWTVTNEVYTAKPTSYQEALAVALAGRIYTRFFTYFNADLSDANGIVADCKLKSITDLIDSVVKFVPEVTAEDYEALATYYARMDATEASKEINEFPNNATLNLPPGAAQLLCSNGKFSYQDNLPMGGMGGGNVSPLHYTWPAELGYFGNSPLRTSEKTLAPINFPQTVASWNKDTSWKTDDGWTGNYVSPVTRSVAMTNSISYSTALLQTQVYYAAPKLYDNNTGVNTNETTDNELSVDGSTNIGNNPDSHRFELTGIVVGGQCREVGWDYLRRKEADDNGFNYMVYDDDMVRTSNDGSTVGTIIPTYNAVDKPASLSNYTLLFDNWNDDLKDQKQNVVYVALEFINKSGRDFWGLDNLVRDGGTFYLIGELDPDKFMEGNELADYTGKYDGEGIDWTKAPKFMPPYDENGNTIKQRRVFMQDFVTKARFGIGANSLKKAYVTVPDLRSANISLGLSVDIEWKDGLSYDVIFGN